MSPTAQPPSVSPKAERLVSTPPRATATLPESKTLYLWDAFNLKWGAEGFRVQIYPTGEETTIAPPDWPYDLVLVHSRSGNLTVRAMRGLQILGVPVAFLDWDGKPIGTFIPNAGRIRRPNLQIRQMEISRDPQRAAKVARKILQAKLDNGGWLMEASKVPDLDVRGLRGLESKLAEAYFGEYRREVSIRWPESRFKLRGHPHHGYKMRAVDPVNSLLNFGYHLLEIRARVLLERVGLSPYFGFLHSNLSEKEPCVYDLQEFERATIDRAVLNVIEDSAVRKASAYSREADWVVRLNQAPIRKLVAEVDSTFSAPVKSGGTVEGRFYREAHALRDWIEAA